MFRILRLLTLTAGVASLYASAGTLMSRMPLRFEPNGGQFHTDVRFSARNGNTSVFLTSREAVLTAGDSVMEISLLKSNRSPVVEGVDPLAVRTSYFKGNQAEGWRTGLTSYGRVRYRGVYPGIDLVYYGNGTELEYDFVLAPGASARKIQIRFRGAERVSVNAQGDLVVESRGGQLMQRKPLVYQIAGDTRTTIPARYKMLSHNVAGVEVGAYDHSQTLVIDPVLTYSSLLGTGGSDRVIAAKTDSQGKLWICGYTGASGITGSETAYQVQNGGDKDVFIAQIDPTLPGGSGLRYLTHFGGSGADIPTAFAVKGGAVYVVGSTTSTNLPLAASRQNTSGGGIDAFVVKLVPTDTGDSQLYYATYLGGSDTDVANGVDVDAKGNIYVIGTTKSSDFKVTSGAYASQLWGPQDAFITVLNPTVTDPVYSTYMGGELSDDGRVINVSPDGIVYFACSTSSTTFPIEGFPINGSFSGNLDVVVGRLNPALSGTASLTYSTYWGGSETDEVRGGYLTPAGAFVITGYTMSGDLPLTTNAAQRDLAGNSDAFVARFVFPTAKTATMDYSTFLGGSGGDVGYGVVTDAANNIYVTGYTISPDFPLRNQLKANPGVGASVFVARLNPVNGLVFSTVEGGEGNHVGQGIAVAPNATMYVVGYTSNEKFTLTPTNAFQSAFNGGDYDGFLMAILP